MHLCFIFLIIFLSLPCCLVSSVVSLRSINIPATEAGDLSSSLEIEESQNFMLRILFIITWKNEAAIGAHELFFLQSILAHMDHGLIEGIIPPSSYLISMLVKDEFRFLEEMRGYSKVPPSTLSHF